MEISMQSNMTNQQGDLRHQSENSKSNADVALIQGSTSSSNVEGSSFNMSMCTRYITVAVLTCVNLLNYMDRYTVAGVLEKVKSFYDIGDSGAGILQSAFIIGYMVFSPIFGYLGDRYNRKYLMTGGILFWSAVTLSSSFVGMCEKTSVDSNKRLFPLFVFLRALVGIGEASYSTIAPTIISDMFVSSKRSFMLMIFYFAIPFGSGLGYIVGSELSNKTGCWQNALRFTPALGIVCALLILCVSREPPRGMAESASHNLHTTSVKQDMKALFKNLSFVFVTLGFTCVAFIAGALALFAPEFMLQAYREIGNNEIKQSTVSFYFGAITCGAGILGILAGSGLAYQVKKRYSNGDALVCAFGLLTASPFLYLAILLTQYPQTIDLSWGCILIGMILVSMNWSLVADIILYTVVPTRRSLAEAMQIFFSHLLGDAGSPFLLGALSDYLRTLPRTSYKSLQLSLYTCVYVGVLGGGLFLACSLFIERDKRRAAAITHGATEQEVLGSIAPVDLQSAHTTSDDDVQPLVL